MPNSRAACLVIDMRDDLNLVLFLSAIVLVGTNSIYPEQSAENMVS
jgi:hypothetical protein